MVYPVATVADATSKRHYYVAMLASDVTGESAAVDQQTMNDDLTIRVEATQRSWTDFEEPLGPSRGRQENTSESGALPRRDEEDGDRGGRGPLVPLAAGPDGREDCEGNPPTSRAGTRKAGAGGRYPSRCTRRRPSSPPSHSRCQTTGTGRQGGDSTRRRRPSRPADTEAICIAIIRAGGALLPGRPRDRLRRPEDLRGRRAPPRSRTVTTSGQETRRTG